MNFYSCSEYHGMKYHLTGTEAKATAEEAIRMMAADGALYAPHEIACVTWGEVSERAASTGEVGYALKRQERLTYEAANPPQIVGRMENANGDLVLIQSIKECDLLEHDMVLSVAAIWENLSSKIGRFKQHNFEDVTTFVDILFDSYKVKRGGTEGNMQFTTFDRKYKLTIAIQKAIDFGPEIQVAKQKMLEAVDVYPESANDLKTMLLATFTQIDGKLRVAEILRLRTYKIENPLWDEAMTIINDAIEVISSKKQIRLHKRNEQGEYIAIPLSIAAL